MFCKPFCLHGTNIFQFQVVKVQENICLWSLQMNGLKFSDIAHFKGNRRNLILFPRRASKKQESQCDFPDK
ncbi:hypothetical protein AV530_017071 [Patagioenas fasciata monilis]|uniref:Uncharacterized protein n=1 Tax=Patagioenas fasciata monilis TaxID=372326 RepID=A0A1V4J4M4_PATFA|nr:hypothetical protein AV530_017071 [Patagioenas fasciata monilis]